MVVGQDVAIRADDDAAAQPGLLLGAHLVAKEKLEPGVVAARVAHFLAGVDADHGRHGLLCSPCQAARGKFGAWLGGGFQQRDARTAVAGAAFEPAGLQGGDDEIRSQQDGDSLRKQKPVTLHTKGERGVAGKGAKRKAKRSFLPEDR